MSSLRAEVMSTDLGILTPRTARGSAEGGGLTHTCIRDHSDQGPALPHASRGAGDDTSLFSGSAVRWGVTAEASGGRWAAAGRLATGVGVSCLPRETERAGRWTINLVLQKGEQAQRGSVACLQSHRNPYGPSTCCVPGPMLALTL